MDFAFTPEQEELRAQARAFLAANPEPSWQELAELGWTGVSVAEENGGAGLGFLEEAILFEEMGRALTHAPYYAVKLYPGDIGAATGLLTDGEARVLDGEGAAIPGLYAVGNDMHSIMGGVYPGPGITIGPGLVFGYLAGRDAAARAARTKRGTLAP